VASATRKYDLYGEAFRADPFATFRAMRAEDPVFRQPGLDSETPIWFVTRYEDVQAVLLDDERFTRDPRRALTEEELGQRAAVPLPDALENHMLNRDGDDHRRLRRLVTKAFTPRVVEGLRPRIQELADDLLDAVEARGAMDLAAEYAFPLPITVIAELLGVPVADHDRFRRWSEAVITPALSPEQLESFFEQMGEFVEYLTALFAERRATPADDLISGLIRARDEGDALSEEELFGTVVLLIVAGHETTVGLIGNGVLNLLTHPDQLELVRADPALLGRAVEELLRFEGPVERTLNRWATTDVELGGETIRRGELVIAIVGSADRDEERFADPDRLDVTRGDRRHLAFGLGPHYCLGAPLARLEAEIALGTLVRRLPGLRLTVPREELEWRPTPGFRRLVSLPVEWDAPPA
jgi:cytochrome P450